MLAGRARGRLEREGVLLLGSDPLEPPSSSVSKLKIDSSGISIRAVLTRPPTAPIATIASAESQESTNVPGASSDGPSDPDVRMTSRSDPRLSRGISLAMIWKMWATCMVTLAVPPGAPECM